MNYQIMNSLLISFILIYTIHAFMRFMRFHAFGLSCVRFVAYEAIKNLCLQF